MEKIGQGEERHPLVMRHIRLDYNPAFPLPLRLPTEIHGLVIAVISEQPLFGHSLQIQHGLNRRQIQCQQRRVGSDHQLFFQSALQAERRHPERLVLKGFFQVEVGKSGFGNTPRHTPHAAIGDLDRHCFPCCLVQE